MAPEHFLCRVFPRLDGKLNQSRKKHERNFPPFDGRCWVWEKRQQNVGDEEKKRNNRPMGLRNLLNSLARRDFQNISSRVAQLCLFNSLREFFFIISRYFTSNSWMSFSPEKLFFYFFTTFRNYKSIVDEIFLFCGFHRRNCLEANTVQSDRRLLLSNQRRIFPFRCAFPSCKAKKPQSAHSLERANAAPANICKVVWASGMWKTRPHLNKQLETRKLLSCLQS